MREAITTLHFGKSSGFDGITAEHIAYAGDSMVYLLVVAANFIREIEYVPKCFKVGLQVPWFSPGTHVSSTTHNWLVTN